ncbi:DUF2550 family protein [Dietzia sp.]|uniref:DUF2550 family protein n=1 Tax=Dietzia sp. TaxID=1871616 RepID=UPI002FD9CAD0
MVTRVLIAVVLVVVVALLVAVAYRFLMFRGSGAPIVMSTPARAGAPDRWRHGILRYTEDTAMIVKLFSLRPTSDLVLRRQSIVLDVARKPGTEGELAFVDPDEVIVPFTATDLRGRPVAGSLALSNQSHAAMRSWVEACSSQQIKGRRARF